MDIPPQPAFPDGYGRELLCVVGFTLLSVDYSSLAVYSGRKRDKSKALLGSKICLPAVPSVQFDKKLPIDLRESKRERHRPKGVAEREGSSSQTAHL